MIRYYFYSTLKKNLLSGKMVLLQGPKGIGKEVVVTEICNELGKTYQIVDLSKKANRKIFEEFSETTFSESKFKVDSIIILEGQYLSNLSALLELGLKEELQQQITITFSYPLNLEGKVLKALEDNEYLYTIFPYTFYEIAGERSFSETEKYIEERILFGSYPSVFNSKNPEIVLKSINADGGRRKSETSPKDGLVLSGITLTVCLVKLLSCFNEYAKFFGNPDTKSIIVF